jgi:hypothetical protein
MFEALAPMLIVTPHASEKTPDACVNFGSPILMFPLPRRRWANPRHSNLGLGSNDSLTHFVFR